MRYSNGQGNFKGYSILEQEGGLVKLGSVVRVNRVISSVWVAYIELGLMFKKGFCGGIWKTMKYLSVVCMTKRIRCF